MYVCTVQCMYVCMYSCVYACKKNMIEFNAPSPPIPKSVNKSENFFWLWERGRSIGQEAGVHLLSLNLNSTRSFCFFRSSPPHPLGHPPTRARHSLLLNSTLPNYALTLLRTNTLARPPARTLPLRWLTARGRVTCSKLKPTVSDQPFVFFFFVFMLFSLFPFFGACPVRATMWLVNLRDT